MTGALKRLNVAGSDGYTSGWAWSYPLKAALQKAVDNKDLTRKRLLNAVKQLTSVDYQGMLPSGAGNYSGSAKDTVVRQNVISKPDDASPTGVSTVKDFFVGKTAEGYAFEKPCFL